MSTAENPAKPRLRYPIDLDEIERMTPEERAEHGADRRGRTEECGAHRLL